jgi:hypothetical protein
MVRIFAAIATLTVAACAKTPLQHPVKAGPTGSGAAALTAARQYLEGAWTLISYEIFSPGRAPIPVTGQGTLAYDAYGNLTIDVRVDAATAQLLADAGIPTTNGRLSTSGRTVVDMQAHTLTYVLEGQPVLFALGGPLDLKRPRYWEVDGDVLTLTTKTDDGQAASIGRWRKQP